MNRIYTDTAHFRAPYNTANISFAGLGDDWQRHWPAGRTYYDIANFRAPYDGGYYQRGNLRGLGATEATRSGVMRGTVAAAALIGLAAAFSAPRGTRAAAGAGGAVGGAIVGFVASVFAVGALTPTATPGA